MYSIVNLVDLSLTCAPCWPWDYILSYSATELSLSQSLSRPHDSVYFGRHSRPWLPPYSIDVKCRCKAKDGSGGTEADLRMRSSKPAGSSIDRSIDVIERAASEGVITEAHTLERAQRRHVGVREGILKGILVHELSREPAHGGWRYGCVGRSRGVVLSIGLEDRDRLLRRPRGGPRSLLSSRFCSTCTLAAESTPVHVHVVCSAV